jgi:hypothetical protein
MLLQDDTAELRARRARILAATRSARIRKGMIRYMLLVSSGNRELQQQHHWWCMHVSSGACMALWCSSA